MNHIKLEGQKRTLFGNKAKTLYRTNEVPAIIYGKIEKPVAVQVNVKSFSNVYKESGETKVIDLTIDGQTFNVLVQDLDIHPVTRKLRNIDFKAVDLTATTTAMVPVTLTGEAPVVKTDNGLVSLQVEELEIEALPEKIPASIIIDISAMVSLEDNIFVKDIKENADYKIITDKDTVVVVVETESKEEVSATVIDNTVVESK